jgi:hypothetical protein
MIGWVSFVIALDRSGSQIKDLERSGLRSEGHRPIFLGSSREYWIISVNTSKA